MISSIFSKYTLRKHTNVYNVICITFTLNSQRRRETIQTFRKSASETKRNLASTDVIVWVGEVLLNDGAIFYLFLN